jgi:hypothetical protein
MEFDFKTAVDIGLGAISIWLWFKQVGVNRMQVKLDEKQNQATQDLTTMVRDHEDRINKLEHNSVSKRLLARKLGKKAA